MGRVVTVHQPVFLPYLGLFEKVEAADRLVVLDDVRFSKRSYVHRNKILVNGEARWLTVPLQNVHTDTLISELQIAPGKAYDKLSRRLEDAYRKAPYFDQVFPQVQAELQQGYGLLADLNMGLFCLLCRILGIDRPMVLSSTFSGKPSDATERNLWLTQAFGGDTYLSGENGLSYMKPEILEASEVTVTYFKHEPQVYKQVGAPMFVPYMSALDYVMNEGGVTHGE